MLTSHTFLVPPNAEIPHGFANNSFLCFRHDGAVDEVRSTLLPLLHALGCTELGLPQCLPSPSSLPFWLNRAWTSSISAVLLPTPSDGKPATSLFGSSSTAQPQQNASTSQTQTSSLFGNTTSQPAQTSSIFGNATSQPGQTSSLFGKTTHPAQASSLFGNTTSQPQQGGMFGSSQNQTGNNQQQQ